LKFTYPEVFAFIAHAGGIAISIWMGRWDLLVAGICFGIPSTWLFHDLSPHGKGWIIGFIRRSL
jgi:hypothetical protein